MAKQSKQFKCGNCGNDTYKIYQIEEYKTMLTQCTNCQCKSKITFIPPELVVEWEDDEDGIMCIF